MNALLECRRNLEQNALFHAIVRDISKQVEWAGEHLDEEEWKRLILAAHYGQKVMPNPFGGGFVVMNTRRSRDLFKRGDDGMSDLITQIYAFGAEKGVVWTNDKA